MPLDFWTALYYIILIFIFISTYSWTREHMKSALVSVVFAAVITYIAYRVPLLAWLAAAALLISFFLKTVPPPVQERVLDKIPAPEKKLDMYRD